MIKDIMLLFYYILYMWFPTISVISKLDYSSTIKPFLKNGVQMQRIYLDHAATTYTRHEVAGEIAPFLEKKFGNPGSFHSIGLEAKKAVNSAREKIAIVTWLFPSDRI